MVFKDNARDHVINDQLDYSQNAHVSKHIINIRINKLLCQIHYPQLHIHTYAQIAQLHANGSSHVHIVCSQ